MTLSKSLLAWFILFVIAFANGMLREFGYKQYTGDLLAHQISCFIGILLIGAAVFAIGKLWPFTSAAHAWKTGFLWLALTIVWEFGFGHFVMGHPWERLLHDYVFWQGRLWSLVLAGIAVLPRLAYARAMAARAQRSSAAAA